MSVTIKIMNPEKYNANVIRIDTEDLKVDKKGFRGELGLETMDGFEMDYLLGYHSATEYLEEFGFVLIQL